MSFFGYYLAYLIAGLSITSVIFFWAVRSGQFKEQRRIRYAPLGTDEPVPVTAETARWPIGMKVTIFLAGSGVVSIVVCAVMAVMLD